MFQCYLISLKNLNYTKPLFAFPAMVLYADYKLPVSIVPHHNKAPTGIGK